MESTVSEQPGNEGTTETGRRSTETEYSPASADSTGASTAGPWWTPLGALHRGTGALKSVEKQLARQPLARLTTVAPRTARWATETVRQRVADPDPANPLIRLTPSLVGHVAMDESVMALAVGPNRFPNRSDYQRVGAELALAEERLDSAGYLDDPASFHSAPPPLQHPATSGGWALGRTYSRISWPSGYEPPIDLPAWDRWQSFESNRTASAWVMERVDRPRPWLVCIHGFGMGAPFTDQFAFHVRRLHEELGINLAGIVLPAHGSRRPSLVSGEQFLNYDLMHAVHGLSQSLWDIRSLLGWVRARDATRLGVFGVSLGGYLTALTAAFDTDLDLALAGIPVVDFVEMFRHHSPRHVHVRALEHHVLDETAERVMSTVSPMAMPVAAPESARAVFAGMGDRLAPPDQARRLLAHWGQPDMCWYPGNHIGYLWADKAWSFVDEMLEARGFTD